MGVVVWCGGGWGRGRGGGGVAERREEIEEEGEGWGGGGASVAKCLLLPLLYARCVVSSCPSTVLSLITPEIDD